MKAMAALIKSGDAEKIIFFAGAAGARPLGHTFMPLLLLLLACLPVVLPALRHVQQVPRRAAVQASAAGRRCT